MGCALGEPSIATEQLGAAGSGIGRTRRGFLLYVTLPVGYPMDLSAGALSHLCCWFWHSCLMGKGSRMQPLARVFGVCAVPAFCFGNQENWCISLGTYERLLL